MRALQIAATGMSAQQTRVEVISNNLANMSTTGYNPRRAEFADLQYQQATRPGTLTATNGDRYEGAFVQGKRQGAGVMHYTSGRVIAGTWRDDVLVEGSEVPPDAPAAAAPEAGQ